MNDDSRTRPVAAVTLSEGAVLLRPWESRDESPLFEAARESIETVGRWLPWLTEGYARADSAAWIRASAEAWKAGQEYRFAIVECSANERLLGAVGLNRIDRVHGMANLGYWVRATATGRGIATSAARLAARFALANLNMARVEILTADANDASRKVAEKLGAHYEGMLRDRLRHGDGMIAARLYCLVRADLRGCLL
jgi:ribosomal-protein-serine acetyltransferase